MRSGTGALAKIEQLLGLWRIQVATGSEAVDKKVVPEFADLSAIISVEVVVVERGAAKVEVAVSGEVTAGAGSNVKYSTESIAVFGSEAAGHQVHGLEDLRAHTRTELRLRIFEERDAVDELMQRKLGTANRQEVVVAVARPGHEVGDEVVGGLDDRFRQTFELLTGEGVRAPSLFRIDGLVFGMDLHFL